MTYGDFMERVLVLCERHSGSVTSAIRTRSRNFAVGGKPESKHLLERHEDGRGFAVDLVLDDMTPPQRMNLIEDAHAMGLGALDEGTHLHVQWPKLGQPSI